MKIRFWMLVYPWQMDKLAQFRAVSNTPISPVEGAKVLAFDVEVPDDLFGARMVEAKVVEP